MLRDSKEPQMITDSHSPNSFSENLRKDPQPAENARDLKDKSVFIRVYLRLLRFRFLAVLRVVVRVR